MEILTLIPSWGRAGQSLTGSPPAQTLLPGILKSISSLVLKFAFPLHTSDASYHHLQTPSSIPPIWNWHPVGLWFLDLFLWLSSVELGIPIIVAANFLANKCHIKYVQNYNNQHCRFQNNSQECFCVYLCVLETSVQRSDTVSMSSFTECCASADFDLLLLSFLALSQATT